jgi:hypothetical protein
MRVEPVTRAREPAAVVDLHFADGERSVTIPFVYVDLAQLDVRELDPLVFPRAIADMLGDATLSAIVERTFPELERRAHGGGLWHEEVVVYAPSPAFEAARAAGFFGAAALAVSLPRIGPALYARRFAVRKYAVAYGPPALEMAAFLRDVASDCAVAGTPHPAAGAWYGEGDREPGAARADVAIGSGPAPVEAIVNVRLDAVPGETQCIVALPLPADLVMSFDPADGPAAATFSVSAVREPFARGPIPIEPAAAGGSSGRIAVVVRTDAAAVPDSDTDEAASLAQTLRREGFTVSVASSIDELDAFGPDLVHLFGVRPGVAALRIAEWAVERRIPLAVHAYYERPADGGYWGALAAPYCFGYSADDRSVQMYLDMLSRRSVVVDEISANVPYAPPSAGLPEAERVLRLADIVFVNSQREFDAIEPLRMGRPTYVVPPLPTVTGGSGPIGPLAGIDPFVLAHAPIGPMDNQLIVVRAASLTGFPLVLAGPVADPAYAERVHEIAGDVRFVPDPSPVVASLYRAATVVVDAAWISRGHGRLATASASGAACVVSSARWADFGTSARWIVDPADVESVARGIGEAWDGSLQRDRIVTDAAAANAERLAVAGIAIVSAYAKMTQPI